MLNRLVLVVVALVALCGLAGCGANRLMGPDTDLARARQAGGLTARDGDGSDPFTGGGGAPGSVGIIGKPGVVRVPVAGDGSGDEPGTGIDPYRIPDDY